jgi:hypothetical protein
MHCANFSRAAWRAASLFWVVEEAELLEPQAAIRPAAASRAKAFRKRMAQASQANRKDR